MVYKDVMSSSARPTYLVMGIGVPSVCQVLVNQGLLVLSSCLQEHFQAHRLQWDLGLGLRLEEENRTELSPQAQRYLSQLSHQSSPVHWSCLILVVGDSEWEVLGTDSSYALVHAHAES